MDQSSLLESARAGSDSALGKLLEQFRPDLRRQAQRQVDVRWQARADESDLAQLTLLTAMHAFAAFHGTNEEELAAWLGAILNQHLAAMARQHLQTEKRSVMREAPPAAPDGSQPGWQPPAAGLSPSGMVMQDEMQHRIEQALEILPWEQREAVRLRFLHDWTTEQIAQVLNKTERAVAGLIHRGLSRLKTLLRRGSGSSGA